MKVIKSNLFLFILFLVIIIVVLQEALSVPDKKEITSISDSETDSTWVAPSLFVDQETSGEERKKVIYGEELIAHTAKYLGPKGSVRQSSNGMNCQNCHLDAGRRPWGNNYSAVFSTYPKFRARSGAVEDIYKRVNDCFERSLNGKPLDTASYEMQSIYAYMKWVGKDVEKGKRPHGVGLPKLPYLDRAADPVKGKAVYEAYCQTCHGGNGAGVLNPDGKTYSYPPLWGEHSYNDGAGLYRLIGFSSFVKNNMPYDQASHTNPKLTDEEAWDVAAFVNSQPRPHKDQKGDYADLSKKPIDFPFAPYADSFSEQQHKYGPYGPIEDAQQKFSVALNNNK